MCSHSEGEDQKMYQDIHTIPSDSEEMSSANVGEFKQHVTEVWSPPRVTATASGYELAPACAYNIETDDAKGKLWDFDDPKQRNK